MDKRIYDNYVIKIVEQGNLSKAAAVLGISQPALSSGLNTLEKELGFKVFHRRKVPIELTAEGSIYYDYLMKVQILEHDYLRRLDSLSNDRDQNIVIGGPVAYMESMVTQAVIELRKEHPQSRVSLKCAPLQELIEMLKKGEIHCFISTSPQLPDNFSVQKIQDEKLYLCVPKNNSVNEGICRDAAAPGEAGSIIDFSVFDGQSFIFMEDNQPLQKVLERFRQEYQIDLVNALTVNQVSTALNFALCGEGICIASESSLHSHRDLSSVYIYSLPETLSGREIYIAYNKDLYMPDICKKFIGILGNM